VLAGQSPNADEPQLNGRSQTGKNYPPNVTEVTACRRIKFFSANLGVFGVHRREFFCFFCKDFALKKL
jgi:hypothetical protein